MVILGAAIRQGLPALRAEAEGRMFETFDVFEPTRVLDETTGEYADGETVIHQGVRGRLRVPTLTVSEREQGAQVPAVQDVAIHVPVGATPGVKVNTMWRCTGSQFDASLIGRVYRTKGEAQAGQVTAHRYPVERVS